MLSIQPLTAEKLESFFDYLAPQLAENGSEGNPLFFPLSKAQSVLSPELQTSFAASITKDFGDKGWRKAWIAIHPSGEIVGHIDIRAHHQPNTPHRVLLGMGVEANFRRQKIGRQLLDFVVQYCRAKKEIYWLDLEVMENNLPAKKLYEAAGFKLLSRVEDMFRIDGKSYAYTAMALRVEGESTKETL